MLTRRGPGTPLLYLGAGLPDIRKALPALVEGSRAEEGCLIYEVHESVDAPGTATYKVTVTNVGTGTARNATLTDNLPAGTWTVTLASPDGDDACPTPAGCPP